MCRSSNGTLNGNLNRSDGPHRARSNDHFSFRAGQPPTQGEARLATPFPGERQTLARLAQFSSRHAEELRRLELREADNRRENRIDDFCAAISTDGDASFRRLLSDRFGTPVNFDRRQSPVARSFLLTEWDAADHPRVPKGQPGGGQWVDKEGGSGVARGRTKGLTVRTAIHTKARSPRLIPVSKPVGHHWVNLMSAFSDEIRPYLSDKAAKYAAGVTSGELDPPHNAKAMNGVTHAEYNRAVKEELKSYIKLKKISAKKKMTARQMEKFAARIMNGLDAKGKPHPVIGPFNEGIKASVKTGVVPPKAMADVLKNGAKQMKLRGFQMLAAGVVISGMANQLVADEVAIANVAARSSNFKQAIVALQTGDLDEAQRLMVGDRDSFFHELIGKVSHLSALNFQRRMEKIFSEARARKYE